MTFDTHKQARIDSLKAQIVVLEDLGKNTNYLYEQLSQLEVSGGSGGAAAISTITVTEPTITQSPVVTLVPADATRALLYILDVILR